jgi:L-alanine-DL-glutamate epimerase-like enolase superfamily enzyme
MIETADGIAGLGEVSCTPVWSGEDGTTAAHLIRRYIGPALIAAGEASLSILSEVVRRSIAGNPFTKAAVDMALWDISGKTFGVESHQMVGGPSRESVGVKLSLPSASPSALTDFAREAVRLGFRAVKVKVAAGGDDVEQVGAVRDAVGPHVLLGIDANGGWRRHNALREIRALSDVGIDFVEQPLPADDLLGAADLRRAIGVPLVADESVGDSADALRVIRSDAADILSIYVGMAGGLTEAYRVATLAGAAGLGWTIGSNLELGIGAAAQIQLALGQTALADDLVPCDIIGPLYYQRDVTTAPLNITGGRVISSGAPGLGVTATDELLGLFDD